MIIMQILFLLMGFLFSVAAVFVTSDFAAQLFLHLLAAIYYVGFALVRAINDIGRRQP